MNHVTPAQDRNHYEDVVNKVMNLRMLYRGGKLFGELTDYRIEETLLFDKKTLKKKSAFLLSSRFAKEATRKAAGSYLGAKTKFPEGGNLFLSNHYSRQISS